MLAQVVTGRRTTGRCWPIVRLDASGGGNMSHGATTTCSHRGAASRGNSEPDSTDRRGSPARSLVYADWGNRVVWTYKREGTVGGKRPCSRRQGFLVTLPRCGGGLQGAGAGFALFQITGTGTAFEREGRGECGSRSDHYSHSF